MTMPHVFHELVNALWAACTGAGDLLNNLCLFVFVAGVGLAVFSFLTFTSPRWCQLGCGVASVLLSLVVVSWRAVQPPGPVDTVTVTPDDTPAPSIGFNAVDRLRQPWDSEERQAKWPVCETLAMLSDIAYRTPVEAEEEVSRLGFSRIIPLVDNSMLGYLVWHEGTAVVVFRGTNQGEASDWAVNLRESTLNMPQGGIHRGFWLAYQSLKPQIMQVLGKIQPKHLWITGHSLGGAMALACAIDLTTNEQMTFDGLITFGQPKVVRDDLAQYVDTAFVGRYARVVVGDDVIARIPPSKAFCGSLVWFLSGSVQRSRPLRREFGASEGEALIAGDWVELTPLTANEFSEWKETNRGATKFREPLPDEPPSYQGNSPYISDHEMAGYIRQVRKHLGIEPL